jgi:CBS domain-containing membrane protein
VHPEAELSDVVDTMLDQKVGALPVVDQRTNSLIGIVSYIDILRAIRDDV